MHNEKRHSCLWQNVYENSILISLIEAFAIKKTLSDYGILHNMVCQQNGNFRAHDKEPLYSTMLSGGTKNTKGGFILKVD